MTTERYQIVRIIKEPDKEPQIFDWDVSDVQNMDNSWLLVYEKDGNAKERKAISFLGTRFITSEYRNLQVIHVTQTVAPVKTGCIFFFDSCDEDELSRKMKGFVFDIYGWLVPLQLVSQFVEVFMDDSIDDVEWGSYYRSLHFFDDFEGTGDMLVKMPE